MEMESIKNTEPQKPLVKELQEEQDIQKEIQQDVTKEKVEVTPQSSQKHVMTLLANAQPLHVVQQIAQNQIEKDKGFDVKI